MYIYICFIWKICQDQQISINATIADGRHTQIATLERFTSVKAVRRKAAQFTLGDKKRAQRS